MRSTPSFLAMEAPPFFRGCDDGSFGARGDGGAALSAKV